MIGFRHFIGCAALAVASQFLAATPASAEDTEKTGLLAALGIEAAGGDTTIAEKGGEIEGYLLASRTLDEAAAKILGRLAGNKGPLLLLTSDESVNLSIGAVLSGRIGRLQADADAAAKACSPGSKALWSEKDFLGGASLTGADVAGALRTDQTIGGFDIALGERALINAMGAANAKGGTLDLRILSDMVAAPGNSPVVASFNALERTVAGLRPCAAIEKPDAAIAKAVKNAASVVSRFDALSSYATAPGEKGAPSPLERAAALGDLVRSDLRLLRVSVEKAGGTTLTRSNIFLKLGAPGAAVVSGGLVAGFRVVDPATGKLEQSGAVLCAMEQIKFASVRKTVLDNKPTADCILSN